MLSGVGRFWADAAGELWRPESPTGVALVLTLWLVLGIVGRTVQKRGQNPAPTSA
ncbi:hypothetical protein [Promicromonospora panici]|uniref:hypothetical protein n=1 Tax=Promicromonospora panici TaxID=2219658 RepID=UPI0013EB305A|nr:hypothetical protein [Promicromonospora panici]